MKYILYPVFTGLLLLFAHCLLAAADEGESSGAAGQVSQRESDHFQEQDTGRQNFKIKMDVNLVTTDVTILGQDIPDLYPEDFVVLDNGVEQQVSHFSRNQSPLAVALLVDTSLSVEEYLPLIQIAAGSWLRNLNPEDQVVLFSFDAAPRRLSNLTHNRVLIAREISRLNFNWGTNLFDTIRYAVWYLRENAPDRRRTIILISDNFHYSVQDGNTHGFEASQSARKEALQSAVTVYSIKTPSLDTDRTGSLPRVMKIALETGGEILHMKKWSSLQAGLAQVISNLRMQYSIGFNPTQIGEKGVFRGLSVKLADKKKCPECRILARSGYYPGLSTALPVDDKPEIAPPGNSPADTDKLLIRQSIETAATAAMELSDLPLKIKTSELADSIEGRRHLKVDLTIDASRIQFSASGDRHAFKLHITIFYTNKTGNILGSDWKIIDGRLKDETYQQVLDKGMLYSTSIPIIADKQMLKIVVYDNQSDRVGSKLVKLD